MRHPVYHSQSSLVTVAHVATTAAAASLGIEPKFNKMSFQTIPTLQKLVIQNVLCEKDLPIPNLEYLPRVLILQLCKEGIMGGHKEMLKKMVLSCPLACLHVDYLVKTGDLTALRTLLYGLSSLIFNKVHPRKWKLKAIDFRMNQACPNQWSRAPLGACSQEATSPKEREKCSQRAAKPSLKIFIEFCPDTVFPRLLFILTEWVMKARRVARIYCKKLQVDGCYSEYTIRRTVSFYYVQELEIQFQLRKVNKLRELYVNNVFFLCGMLHKILLSRTPLKTLSLRDCPLKEKDLKHLSLCPSTDQLKCLDLSSFSMKDMSPEPLRVLLEKVAHTLETLVLEFCEITESQLNAISPALGHCSQLKTFSFCGNQIPLTALKNLLSHTASLPLEQAKYPAPLEIFDEILGDSWTEINPMKFDQVQNELIQLMKDIRPVHDIQIYSYNCILHFKRTDFIA
ncbi:PRAME family member 12-like [Marmota flaviventris]|uniref:PRAME family member 12-like n=1 Tax=Marmota flaviventris TaxID=93162 RepID=UPI003A8A62F2